MSQTAAQILTPLNLPSTFLAATKEGLVDAAIDLLNLYKAPAITSMDGTAGAKTVTLTSRQRAAVLYVTRAIYASFYLNAGATNVSLSGLSLSQVDLLSNATVIHAVEAMAAKLRDDGELPYLIFAEYDMEEE